MIKKIQYAIKWVCSNKQTVLISLNYILYVTTHQGSNFGHIHKRHQVYSKPYMTTHSFFQSFFFVICLPHFKAKTEHTVSECDTTLKIVITTVLHTQKLEYRKYNSIHYAAHVFTCHFLVINHDKFINTDIPIVSRFITFLFNK